MGHADVNTMYTQTKLSSPEADVQEVSSDNAKDYALDDLRKIPSEREGSHSPITMEAGGVVEVEGMQAVWGKYGKYFLWAG